MRSDKSDKSDKGDFGSHHVYYFESRLTSNEDDSQHTTWNDFVVPASLVVICSTSLAKLGASWLSKACSITTLLELEVPQLEMGPSINVPSRARHTNNRQLNNSSVDGNWSRERPSRTSIGSLCIGIFSKYFNPESQNRRWTHWSTFIIYSSTRFLAWKRPSIFPWSRFTSCSIHRTLWKFCTLASKHESNVDGVQFGDLIEFVDMDFDNRVLKVNGACAQDWRCGNSDKHQELLRKPLWIPGIPVFWRAIPLWCGRKTQMLMGDTKS